MQKTKEILLTHFSRYPLMEPADAVKLLYQSVFGGGHLITDRERVRARLQSEAAQTAPTPDVPCPEEIGADVFRLHLGALPRDFSLDTVFEIFCASADEVRGTMEDFRSRLELLVSLCGAAPFTKSELEAYLTSYLADGAPAVSHSETYRVQYAPHYRLISRTYAKIWPLLCAIEAQLAKGQPVRIAIDGPSGTGKSTLASRLQSIYRCPVYHMDDFFLPPEAKTAQRLATPGGNVDYERFYEEITLALIQGRPVTYRPYICYLGHMGGAVTHAPSPVTILEGAYSNHEALREGATLRVKLTLPLETRLERIRARDGEQMLSRFIEEWIPLEDLYFERMATEDTFDFILAM